MRPGEIGTLVILKDREVLLKWVYLPHAKSNSCLISGSYYYEDKWGTKNGLKIYVIN